jgi:hypothetical protein
MTVVIHRILAPLTVAGLCMALAVPARAQLKPELQTGSMIPVQPKAVAKKDAGFISKGMARCLYRGATPQALALLENSDSVTVDLAAAKLKNIVKDLRMERCLGDQAGFDQSALSMRTNPPLIRDMLAEEAYLARNRTAPTLPPSPAPLAAKFASTGASLLEAQRMESFTDCAVRKDVTGADALLRTTPASDAERNAARALAPALGGCLVQGQNVKLSPGAIRAFIAYAMWRRFVRGTAPL